MDRGCSVDLNSAVVPCRYDFSGCGLGFHVEFGRDVVMRGPVEEDHYFGLEGVGGCLRGGFD